MMRSVQESVREADAVLAVIDASLRPRQDLAMVQPGPDWDGPPMAVVRREGRSRLGTCPAERGGSSALLMGELGGGLGGAGPPMVVVRMGRAHGLPARRSGAAAQALLGGELGGGLGGDGPPMAVVRREGRSWFAGCQAGGAVA
jgi:hypothetical protein